MFKEQERIELSIAFSYSDTIDKVSNKAKIETKVSNNRLMKISKKTDELNLNLEAWNRTVWKGNFCRKGLLHITKETNLRNSKRTNEGK